MHGSHRIWCLHHAWQLLQHRLHPRLACFSVFCPRARGLRIHRPVASGPFGSLRVSSRSLPLRQPWGFQYQAQGLHSPVPCSLEPWDSCRSAKGNRKLQTGGSGTWEHGNGAMGVYHIYIYVYDFFGVDWVSLCTDLAGLVETGIWSLNHSQ